MKLLVSVSNADEARSAVSGGADIIDAKDPSMGALGAVGLDAFARIRQVVDPARLVTAALGDADGGSASAVLARGFVTRGAALVKVGFAAVTDPSRVGEMIARVVEACVAVNADAGVVAVAYADVSGEDSLGAMRLVPVAATAGAAGVLVDTAYKRGPGLTSIWSADTLAAWVAEAHAHGLFAAVAGKLMARDLAAVCGTGADIAGVRGAVCEGGRTGVVSAERVETLRRAVVGRSHAVPTMGLPSI